MCGALAVDRVKYEGNDDKLKEIEAKQVSIAHASPHASAHAGHAQEWLARDACSYRYWRILRHCDLKHCLHLRRQSTMPSTRGSGHVRRLHARTQPPRVLLACCWRNVLCAHCKVCLWCCADAEDFWFSAEMQPQKVTAFSMDAPTETQFDVPSHPISAYDPVKSLEGARKWKSKVTGVMLAGLGMLTWVTRAGLGSGPNLSCTVLLLSLLYMVEHGRPLGSKFHLLVDGTASDNKNNELIFFLAWLVENDIFDEAVPMN